MSSIGIFAGTFDPIHDGHINFANQAIKESGLNKVIIVAEKKPYRKTPLATWDHRQAMIEHATQELEQIDHDYEFANKLAHQHTILDMLNTAKKHYGSEHSFWFLVGSDVFEHIKNWQDMVSHNEYGGFIVTLRSEHTTDWVYKQLEKLNKNFNKINIKFVDNVLPKMSSTQIRRAASQKDFSNIKPQSVAEYIAEHQLYQVDTRS